jgi:dTDP-4-amino-4,6-dideoxygalactose transaminase
MLPQGPPRWPLQDEAVQAALFQAWRDGDWGRYHGDYCNALVDRLAEMHGVEYVMLCCSGTYAVEAALRGLSIGAGDEVILAGYDFPGNFRAIEAVGARPVLIDIDPGNWSLDPDLLEMSVGESTRAVIVSHLHGGMVAMKEISAWAGRHGIAVVEDACQATGAHIDARLAGSAGDVGVISFGGSKLLTAGRGGALLTSRADVYQRIKVYGHRGNDAFPLSELQAAVLLPQCDRLTERNERRRTAVQLLLESTRQLPGLVPLANRVESVEPSFYKLAWHYLAEELHGHTRDEFIAAMRAEGVAVDAGFRGFATRSQRRCRHGSELDASLAAADDTVLLHHPVLLEDAETIARAAAAFEKVVRAFAAR